jgi:hypothetical protein
VGSLFTTHALVAGGENPENAGEPHRSVYHKQRD